jgi:hypothetical protein
MSGQYTIVKMQHNILGVAAHDYLVVLDPNGHPVYEIDALATQGTHLGSWESGPVQQGDPNIFGPSSAIDGTGFGPWDQLRGYVFQGK